MKHIFLIILGLLLFGSAANAQSQRNPCWYKSGSTTSGCLSTGADNPLPVAIESGGSSPGAGSQPYNYSPVAGSQYGLGIVASTALTVPATALQAQICIRGNSVNYTKDGTTTPTTSVGMSLAVGQCIEFSGPLVLANLKFIQTAATATLDVEYTK